MYRGAFVNEEVNARLSKAAESIKAGQLAESPKITKEEWKCGELFLIMDSVGVSLEDSERLAKKIEEEYLGIKNNINSHPYIFGHPVLIYTLIQSVAFGCLIRAPIM